VQDYRRSLRAVGTALIAFGLLDIAFMVYCIATVRSYWSSFNIFAVIAGIYLRRGNLRGARVVALFSAFYLSGFVGVLVITPLIVPSALITLTVRLYPFLMVGSLLLVVGVLAFLAWVYRRLTAPAILAAMDREHINCRRLHRRPSLGFVVGGLLALLLLILLRAAFAGEDAARARSEARGQLGPGYKYWVSSLSTHFAGGQTTVDATVIAYSSREVREVKVKWKQ